MASIKLVSRLSRWVLTSLLLFVVLGVNAQTLPIPDRPRSAQSGAEFIATITPLDLAAREEAIFKQVLSGNVPSWLRQLAAITNSATVNGTNITIQYYVTPDYLAVGADSDYFLTPMTPLLGQRLAERLNSTLPTRKMVDSIWKQAPCKLEPSPIPPTPAMSTIPVMQQHNATVKAQRLALTNEFPLGTLTAGHKKDVVLSQRIYTNFARPTVRNPVVIYGWHRRSGAPIQPLYNGHDQRYVDYSHGIRLVLMEVKVNGTSNTVTNILRDPVLAPLLSDEGAMPRPFYPSW